MNYNTNVLRQSRKKGATNMFLTIKQKVEIMNECGDSALILMEFYLSKSGTPNYSYADDKVGKSLNWKPRKVEMHRQRLQKAKWFRQDKGKYNSGEPFVVTVLGGRYIKNDIDFVVVNAIQ